MSSGAAPDTNNRANENSALFGDSFTRGRSHVGKYDRAFCGGKYFISFAVHRAKHFAAAFPAFSGALKKTGDSAKTPPLYVYNRSECI